MKVLVTGGGGFLGKRIVQMLVARGDQVRILARGRYADVEALGVEGLQVDLGDPLGVARAVRGMDAVVHTAAKAGVWGPREEYWRHNVEGTQNVLDALKAEGVSRLVYTSTPSVTGYSKDIDNGAQDIPYAEKHGFFYGESKAEAEKRVRAANGVGLATVSLRPHLVVGPGDNNVLPRIVARAKAGRLIQVGAGTNKVDVTYIDNAAAAHVDALDRLTGPDAPCAGKAYFISNDEPVVLWTWIRELLEPLGLPGPSRTVSLGTATALAGVLEAAWTWLPLSGEPFLTRSLAAALAMSHWYDMGPAKRDLGYTIRVPMAEATARTVAWLKTQGAT